MRDYFEFYCPVKIIAGQQALENIPFELTLLGVRRVLLITDAGVRQNGLLTPILQAFVGMDIEIGCIIDDVPSDSSLQVVKQVSQAYRTHECQAILAVGGGSVIDTAKTANILVSLGGDDLMAYAGAHNLPKPLNPLFVVPTTAGTGSEVTMVAVISDDATQQKIAFASYHLLPNVAILDPRMTKTLPPRLTAMTAMDALTHAIEAYTGLAHNPLSDAYAISAIELVATNLPKALDTPDDSDARLGLAVAATMAGMAFSNSMVGLVHALGHGLGAIAHLPHGVCMNIFLPVVLSYNLDHDGERLGRLLLPLAGESVYLQTAPDQRADALIRHIRTLQQSLHARTGLPYTLEQTGQVQISQFDAIAKKALNDGSIIYNQKEATLDDLTKLLHQAWHGEWTII